MSTRATYNFKDKWHGEHCVYIHHDGYPNGAAYYFNNALMQKQKCNVDSFFRANLKAEHTSSHDAHGDTEYRYEIWVNSETHETMVKGIARCINKGYQHWEVFFRDTLTKFIETYPELIQLHEQEKNNGR